MGIRFTHPARHILWSPFECSPGDCGLVSQADTHLPALFIEVRRIWAERQAAASELELPQQNGMGDSAKQTRVVRVGPAFPAEPRTFFGRHRDLTPIPESLPSLGTKGTGPPRSALHPRCLAFAEQRRSPCSVPIPSWR
jgi:hypothetical protein